MDLCAAVFGVVTAFLDVVGYGGHAAARGVASCIGPRVIFAPTDVSLVGRVVKRTLKAE